MQGRKGDFLRNYCTRQCIGYASLDYRAHGASGGHDDWATQATISNFLTDTLWVLDHVIEQQPSSDIVLVGSSMGAWLSLLVAQRARCIGGLILLAPAVDLTRYYPDPATQRQYPLTDAHGRVYYQVPNRYDNGQDEPYYLIYESMLQDGEQYYLLNDNDDDETTSSSLGLDKNMPIRILHGSHDVDIPVEQAHKFVSTLLANNHADAQLTVIEQGDHRLSEPTNLQILEQTLNQVVSKVVKKQIAILS